MSLQTIQPEKQEHLAAPMNGHKLRPPLEAGDRLSRAEFHRRYLAHPEIKRAELIEGVVYVPSPIRAKQHADPHADVIAWLSVYRSRTPGTKCSDNATLFLDNENEVQPDALLRLEPEVGGQSHVRVDDYLEGAPELIVEVAASSVSYDLHDKRRVYARNGVQEYIVLQTYEQQLSWFVLREGVYEQLLADGQAIIRSEIFPGLWLKCDAFWAGDLAQVLAVLQQGFASPEHTAFVEKLEQLQNK